MSTLNKLAGHGNKLAARVLDAFNPDQERDERGRWGSGGPGSGASNHDEHKASAESHARIAVAHANRGNRELAQAHTLASVAHEKARTGMGDGDKARRLSAKANAAEASKGGKTPNDPRTTSSAEQDRMEARQLASGERVSIAKSEGGYRGNPVKEGSNAMSTTPSGRKPREATRAAVAKASIARQAEWVKNAEAKTKQVTPLWHKFPT